jgi:iron complex outermembrane recepter protein
LTWVGGLYYGYSKVGYTPLDLYLFGTSLGQSVSDESTTNSAALFGDATYKFTDQWSATLGLRYTHEKKALLAGGTESSFPPLVPESLVLPLAPGQKNFDVVTPKLSIDYRRAEGMYYFTASQGFKSGLYNISAPSPVSNAPVDPEKLTALELGAKWQFVQDRVRLNAAIYHYDYKDIQVSVVAGYSTENQNAAKATIKGAEADLAALATENLTLRAGVAYIDGKYDSYPNAIAYVPNTEQSLSNPAAYVTPQNGLNLSGNTLPRAPKLTSTVGFDWKYLITAGSVTGSGTWYHTDKFYFDATNTASTGPYDLLNASVTYRSLGDRWNASLWGKNLGDTRYLSTSLVSEFGRVDSYGIPRTYGVTLGFKFK